MSNSEDILNELIQLRMENHALQSEVERLRRYAKDDTKAIRRLQTRIGLLQSANERLCIGADQDDKIIRRLQNRVGLLLVENRNAETDRDYGDGL